MTNDCNVVMISIHVMVWGQMSRRTAYTSFMRAGLEYGGYIHNILYCI